MVTATCHYCCVYYWLVITMVTVFDSLIVEIHDRDNRALLSLLDFFSLTVSSLRSIFVAS